VDQLHKTFFTSDFLPLGDSQTAQKVVDFPEYWCPIRLTLYSANNSQETQLSKHVLLELQYRKRTLCGMYIEVS